MECGLRSFLELCDQQYFQQETEIKAVLLEELHKSWKEISTKFNSSTLAHLFTLRKSNLHGVVHDHRIHIRGKNLFSKNLSKILELFLRPVDKR